MPRGRPGALAACRRPAGRCGGQACEQGSAASGSSSPECGRATVRQQHSGGFGSFPEQAKGGRNDKRQEGTGEAEKDQVPVGGDGSAILHRLLASGWHALGGDQRPLRFVCPACSFRAFAKPMSGYARRGLTVFDTGRLSNFPRNKLPSTRRLSPCSIRVAMAPSRPRILVQ